MKNIFVEGIQGSGKSTLINNIVKFNPELHVCINEVNHIGTNINQIVHNNNSGLYSETDKEQLVAYMRKLNVEVNKVYEVISERKSGNM